MLQPGVSGPAIELNDLENRARSLHAELKRGPVVLAFFKISCPTCQLTFPFLQRLSGSANVVAVSQDDARDTRDFHGRFGISIPTLLDSGPKYAASNAYGITNVPSIFVIETNGTISSAFHGFSKAELERLGQRFGVPVFRETDRAPAMQPG